MTKQPDKAAARGVVQALASLDTDRQIADFHITCEEREWNVHRFVLFLHSRVLAAACTREFQEAESKSIKLEDDPECVDAMIAYFYHLNYDCDGFTLQYPLANHVKMCIIADKYDVPCLQSLAVRKFHDYAKSHQISDAALTEAAVIAYEVARPTKDIRPVIVRYALANGFLAIAEDGSSGPMEKLMRESPELATDVAVSLLADGICNKNYRCQRDACSRSFSVPLSESDKVQSCPYCNSTGSYGR